MLFLDLNYEIGIRIYSFISLLDYFEWLLCGKSPSYLIFLGDIIEQYR